MQISILPKTSLGKWSFGLACVIIFIAILTPILEYQIGLELKPRSAVVIALGSALGVSGIGALVTGLLGLRKSKVVSVLVFLAIILGFLP